MEKILTPVDISDDITPITRKPIDKVDSNQWKEFSEYELFDQLDILTARRDMAYRISKPAVAIEIQKGIDRLTKLLNKIQDNRDDGK